MQDRRGNIYEATLNIADGRDRRILYDISNIRKIDKKSEAADGDVPSTEFGRGSHVNSNFKNSVAENGKAVNREYSYKSDYEDYLNALEQDEEGTKSNFASLEENAPPEREEADGFDEVYEYLMDEDLAQYDRDHENKLNALAESEAPEETAPPTITRKDLDDYSKLIL